MAVLPVSIETVDHASFTEADLTALNIFENRREMEEWPGLPPIPKESTALDIHLTHPWRSSFRWLARRPSDVAVVGAARLDVQRVGGNRHLASVDIYVLPEMRLRGVARALLAPVVETAKREGRELLLVRSNSFVPAGEAFARRLGARWGTTIDVNHLDMATVDLDLMRRWLEPVWGFELRPWEGPFGTSQVEAYLSVQRAMNTAPRDSLEMQDTVLTLEQIRQSEFWLAQRKTERWALFAHETGSGEVAGYTEVFWDAHRPEMIWQGDTVVIPQFRGRGLGRWLKATMFQKVVRDRPKVRRIQTFNARSNTSMLKINHDMGFRLYKTVTTWQVDTAQVSDYLAGKR